MTNNPHCRRHGKRWIGHSRRKIRNSLIGLFLCLALSPGILAGQKSAQAFTDSLLAVLPKAASDTQRVNLLNQISKSALYTDPEQSLSYAHMALREGEQIGYVIGRVRAYHTLGSLSFNKGNYSEALAFGEKGLLLAREEGDQQGVVDCHQCIGNAYNQLGNNPKALESYFSSLRVAEAIQYKSGISAAYCLIGLINMTEGNYEEALKNFFASFPICEEIGDHWNASANLNNIAEVYRLQGKWEEALKYYFNSIALDEQYGFSSEVPYNNIGLVEAARHNHKAALLHFAKSMDIARSVLNEPMVLETAKNMGISSMHLHNFPSARRHLGFALDLLQKVKNLEFHASVYAALASLDSATGDWQKAFEHHKQYVEYRDSLINENNTKKMVQTAMQYEFDKKEAATKAQQEKKDSVQRLIRNGIIGSLVIALLFLAIVFRQRNRVKREKQLADEEKLKAEAEKKKSEQLLLNILPAEVAEELKTTGSAKTKAFTMVTVMLTDFKDFTSVSEKVSAELLVDEIHHCFSAFDAIIQKHRIEKIKTIGDAYLCASGLPVSSYTHATDMVEAAFEIRQFILQRKAEKEAKGEIPFELRIGIHTGPVVAGIVGVKKYAYDIWGDTVNIAARMEQNGEVGMINISGSTYELIKTKFSCTHRGKIEAKNKGMIDMYFVDSPI